MCLFQFIEVEHGILAHEDFHHLGRKEIHIVHRMVANEHTGLCSVFKHDEQTTVHHEVDIRTEDIYQLDGLVNDYSLRHIKQETILCKGSIESRNGILRGIGQLAVVLLHQFGMLRSQFLQATEQHAFGQMSLRQRLAIESIIHDEIEGGAHVRHIALEHFIRIDRNVETIQVQAIIGCEELGRIGIFVSFLLRSWETLTFEVGKSLGTRCVHHLGAVPTNHGFALRKEVNILLFRFHHSPNSFFIQSKPRFSISNANSGPAVLTMRPL